MGLSLSKKAFGLDAFYFFGVRYPAKTRLRHRTMTRAQKPQTSPGMLDSAVVFTKPAAIIIKNSMALVRTRPGIIRCRGYKPRQTGITAEMKTISAAIERKSRSLKYGLGI